MEKQTPSYNFGKLSVFLQAPEVSKFSQEFRKFFGETNKTGVPQRMT